MTPDKRIVRKLQAYDPKLFVKWDNFEKVWEVWRHMPHGERLVTPVTKFIFTLKKEDVNKYVKLDNRILNWLYMADSQSKNRKSRQSIKYIRDKNKADFHRKAEGIDPKKQENMEYLLRENFYIANRATLNPWLHQFRNGESFERPDVQRGRVSTRSGTNARKHFGDKE